jgi:release factor glutamine methyltransferase
MNESQPWTIQRLLAWTSDYLREKSSDSPRLDAEVLLAAVLDCARIDLYTRFDQVPTPTELTAFRESVKRRASGEPVAYIVGQKEFFAISFDVTRDVLVPRPETEMLVMETIDRARKHFGEKSITIVDVGTGSGNIAISLARHLPQSRILATDQSPQALDVARRNAETHELSERVEFFLGDLLQPVVDRRPFDFVVSNPPYIGMAERGSLPRSVVDYEPELALFSGEQGTETIERLLQQVPTLLNPSGWLLIEISPIISDRVRKLASAQSSWAEHSIKKDLAGLDRLLICQLKTCN